MDEPMEHEGQEVAELLAMLAHERNRLAIAEQALREREQAALEQDERLANLACEIRTPLGPLLCALELLERHPEAPERAIRMMERQLIRLSRIPDDVVDLIYLGRGRSGLRRARRPVAEALHAAVDATCPHIAKYAVTLAITAPDEPILVDGDHRVLASAFTKLLDHAAVSSPKGGRIRLDVERQADEVVATIEPMGPIDGLTRVFDWHFELCLAKELVELHGGSVTAHVDERDQSGRVVVRLPVAPALPSDEPDDAAMTSTTPPSAVPPERA